METIHLDFKSGLEALLKQKPTKAIFIGTRIGDPNAVCCHYLKDLIIHCYMSVRCIINALYKSVLSCRLVRIRSLLVLLGGRLS